MGYEVVKRTAARVIVVLAGSVLQVEDLDEAAIHEGFNVFFSDDGFFHGFSLFP